MKSMQDGEPAEPQPEDCCGQGCASCVWDVYREKLIKWQASRGNISDQCEKCLSKFHFTPCTLLAITFQTNDTSLYKFSVAECSCSKWPLLQPGQHLELKAFYSEEEIIRKYSPINWNGCEFDVIIKRYKTGKMSLFLESVKEGENLDWRGPYGSVTYKSKDQKLLLMLCAGTGVAPMIPIVRSIVEDPDDETIVKMLCGSHTLKTRLLLKELKELAGFWNFSFTHCVPSLDGSPSWGESVVRSHISEASVVEALQPIKVNECKFLICGPEAFNMDMKKVANKIGVPYYCF
ncbi:hypothetical protein B566_EDAN014155 [Ephemera danica]|nr:hypothetical protein B566_EDAN014155 [Ephemera danica]